MKSAYVSRYAGTYTFWRSKPVWRDGYFCSGRSNAYVGSLFTAIGSTLFPDLQERQCIQIELPTLKTLWAQVTPSKVPPRKPSGRKASTPAVTSKPKTRKATRTKASSRV